MVVAFSASPLYVHVQYGFVRATRLPVHRLGPEGTSLPSKARLRIAWRSRSVRLRFVAMTASSSSMTERRRSTSATMRCCSGIGAQGRTSALISPKLRRGRPTPWTIDTVLARVGSAFSTELRNLVKVSCDSGLKRIQSALTMAGPTKGGMIQARGGRSPNAAMTRSPSSTRCLSNDS